MAATQTIRPNPEHWITLALIHAKGGYHRMPITRESVGLHIKIGSQENNYSLVRVEKQVSHFVAIA